VQDIEIITVGISSSFLEIKRSKKISLVIIIGFYFDLVEVGLFKVEFSDIKGIGLRIFNHECGFPDVLTIYPVIFGENKISIIVQLKLTEKIVIPVLHGH